ncbi:MAG: hypothetical protein JWL98_27, partial [Xanthomonadaceae bacterium]|nr:hypothetical protein [Xanthomonadaceae bacterium]
MPTSDSNKGSKNTNQTNQDVNKGDRGK